MKLPRCEEMMIWRCDLVLLDGRKELVKTCFAAFWRSPSDRSFSANLTYLVYGIREDRVSGAIARVPARESPIALPFGIGSG